MLRDPVKRAEAVFRAAGIGVGEAEVPKASPSFLMEVMEQREALSDAREAKGVAAIMALMDTVQSAETEALLELTQKLAFDEGGTREELIPLLPRLSELRYYRRFLEEAERALEDAT